MQYRVTQGLSLTDTTVQEYSVELEETYFYPNFFFPSEALSFFSYNYMYLSSTFYNNKVTEPSFGAYSVTLVQGEKTTHSYW